MDHIKNAKRTLHKRTEMSSVMYPGGSCILGMLRLFVCYDGTLFPCERVNENLNYYQIGSIEDGFYMDKMRDILNVGKLMEKECKTCWNLQRCSICSNEISWR